MLLRLMAVSVSLPRCARRCDSATLRRALRSRCYNKRGGVSADVNRGIVKPRAIHLVEVVADAQEEGGVRSQVDEAINLVGGWEVGLPRGLGVGPEVPLHHVIKCSTGRRHAVMVNRWGAGGQLRDFFEKIRCTKRRSS